MVSVYIRSPRYAKVIFERIYTLAAFKGLMLNGITVLLALATTLSSIRTETLVVGGMSLLSFFLWRFVNSLLHVGCLL